MMNIWVVEIIVAGGIYITPLVGLTRKQGRAELAKQKAENPMVQFRLKKYHITPADGGNG